MTAKWGTCAILALCLAIHVGCRSSQPNVKPDITQEKLVDPPQEARFDSPGLPRQAYEKQVDPFRSAFDAKTSPGVMPARGGMSPGAGMGAGGYR